MQGKVKSASASPRSRKGSRELLRSGTGFNTERPVSCGTGQRLGQAVAHGAIAHNASTAAVLRDLVATDVNVNYRAVHVAGGHSLHIHESKDPKR